MKHFPIGWTSVPHEDFLTKVEALLTKFGQLEARPTAENTAQGKVVWATYSKDCADGKGATAAASKLNGVDNRTETQKKQANHGPPAEHDMFSVQVVDPWVPSTHDENSDTAGTLLRVSGCPVAWTVVDVKPLMIKHGKVDKFVSEGRGSFLVTFKDAAAASSASDATHGLEFREGNKLTSLMCDLHIDPAEGGAGPDVTGSSAWDDTWADTQSSRASSSAAQPARALEDQTRVVLYADELIGVIDGDPDPRPDDRQIFVRDLPLDDYNEQELLEWLQGFGQLESDSVNFLRDPASKALTGCAYVRFAEHAEAKGLIEAFAQPQMVDDDGGNVKGFWSNSERMLQGAIGPYKFDVVDAVFRQLPRIQRDLRCTEFIAACDGREWADADAELQALDLHKGPLHFIVSGKHSLGTREALRDLLAKFLRSVLDRPQPAVAAARQPAQTTRAPSQQEAVSSAGALPLQGPYIEIKGIPASWDEKYVKNLFIIFGGAKTVRLFQRDQLAHVCLKNAGRTENAANELDNKEFAYDEDSNADAAVIRCRVIGGQESKSKSDIVLRTIFLDELGMKSRPKKNAGARDREVFLRALPVGDCTKKQIFEYLEGFGKLEKLEDLWLLPSDTDPSKPKGNGYAKFATHSDAQQCLNAHAGDGGDEMEGDVLANWSESERAIQGEASIYSKDIHKAFDNKALEAAKKATGIEALWMSSQLQKPSDHNAQVFDVNYMHFTSKCTEEQFTTLREHLTKKLADFHKSVVQERRDKSRSKSVKRRETAETRSGPSVDKPWSTPPTQHHSWQSPPAPHAYQHGRPPPHAWPQHGYNPHVWPPPPPGPAWGYPPPPGPPGLPEPARPPGSFGMPPGSFAAPPPAARCREPGAEGPESAQDPIKQAETRIIEARDLVHTHGASKAYRKYCEVLKTLLGIMEKLPDGDPGKKKT
jgi:RNA recognition motif-containing protein